jgi:peptide/nickel transport system substrate-binding protein
MKRSIVTRRGFLLVASGGAIGVLAAACAPAAPPAPTQAPAVPAKPTEVPKPAAAPTTVPAPAAAAKPTEAAKPTIAPAPAAAPTTAAVAIKRGGALNWGEPADPIGFDPHNRNNASSTVLRRMVYESFTRHNPRTLAVEPALATRWEYTKPTEIVWTLRENVTFHDGTPFSAEDAKWNVDRMIDPATANPFGIWYEAIEKSEVVNSTTLRTTLKQPDPVLPGKFAATVVSGFAPGGSNPANLATQPIGTGPYKLAEYIQNDRVTLQRNGTYWDKDVAYIDTFNVKFLPQEDTRIAALRAGQMDFSILSADGAKRLAGAQNLKFIKGVHGVFTVFKLNQRFEPFKDVRVRRAMDLATDKQEIIDKALGGSGVMTGPIVAGWEDYGIPPAQLGYKVDIDAAKKLMADAGFANGFEVTGVTLPEGQASNFYPTMATAAEQWKKIGINVKLEPLELGAWLDKNNKLDYDLIVSNRGFRGDPIDLLYPHYHRKGNDNPGYVNADVEKWIEQAQVEPDRVKRRDLYLQIQKQVLQDVPWIYLWAPVENYGMQQYVMGYDHVAFDSYKDLFVRTWLNK